MNRKATWILAYLLAIPTAFAFSCSYDYKVCPLATGCGGNLQDQIAITCSVPRGWETQRICVAINCLSKSWAPGLAYFPNAWDANGCRYDKHVVGPANFQVWIGTNYFTRGSNQVKVSVTYVNGATQTRTIGVSCNTGECGQVCVLKPLQTKCAGDYLMREYQYPDCTTQWKIVNYCPYGCYLNSCLSERGLPRLELANEYKVKPCSTLTIPVTIYNSGTSAKIWLEVKGVRWIRVPSKISLKGGESKVFNAIADVPCEAGYYPFTLSAIGAINFTQPSVIRVEKTEISAPVLAIAVIACLAFFFSVKKKKKRADC